MDIGKQQRVIMVEDVPVPAEPIRAKVEESESDHATELPLPMFVDPEPVPS